MKRDEARAEVERRKAMAAIDERCAPALRRRIAELTSERDEARVQANDAERRTESWQALNTVYLRERDEARAAYDKQYEDYTTCVNELVDQKALREANAKLRAELASHIATWDGDGWREQVREARAEVEILRSLAGRLRAVAEAAKTLLSALLRVADDEALAAEKPLQDALRAAGYLGFPPEQTDCPPEFLAAADEETLA